MNRTLLIARREFMAYAKTVGFWLSLLAFPLFGVLGGAIPLLMKSAEPTRQVALVDEAPAGSGLAAAVKQALESEQARGDISALRMAAIPEAGPVLLEPIGALKAHVPADNTGDIMGEVTKRRGRVLGMNPDDDGLQVVEAEVPVAEMQDFTTFLRQLTQGRGYFTFEFVRYETLPQMLENKVIEQAKALGNFADED